MWVFQNIILHKETNSAESQAEISLAFHFVERNYDDGGGGGGEDDDDDDDDYCYFSFVCPPFHSVWLLRPPTPFHFKIIFCSELKMPMVHLEKS